MTHAVIWKRTCERRVGGARVAKVRGPIRKEKFAPLNAPLKTSLTKTHQTYYLNSKEVFKGAFKGTFKGANFSM